MRVKNYKTTLFENEFSTKVPFNNSTLTFWEESEIERWITYEAIIKDLTELEYHTLNYELQYRLYEGENINDVLMSIVTRNKETKSTIGYHKSTIQHYLNQDFMNMFK